MTVDCIGMDPKYIQTVQDLQRRNVLFFDTKNIAHWLKKGSDRVCVFKLITIWSTESVLYFKVQT